MTKPGAPEPDPSAIGVIPKAVFARLPDPVQLFARRAARLRELAPGHDLAEYLTFLAGIADIQAEIQAGLPPAEAPPRAALAARHAMPPLDRAGFAPGPELGELLDRLLARARRLDMPEAARAALDRVEAAGDAERAAMARNLLEDAIPFEAVAEHALVAAALQVHFARAASALDASALTAVGDGVCPACGGPPVASLVVDWAGAGGVRYCVCSLCATEWNYVRAKCTLCGSTKAIAFKEIAGSGGLIKAEACGDCGGYVKVLYRQKHPGLDPVADDVASLGLDLLVRELDYRRGAVNPFLVGY
jgi:FdhE protein